MQEIAKESGGRPGSYVLDILAVFGVAFLVIAVGWRLVGEGAFARQAVVWLANVAMLLTIWLGLRRRGQTFEHFGLSFHAPRPKRVLRAVLFSVLVLVATLAAFVLGSVIASGLAAGQPAADMSGYDYLRGNLPMLLLALVAVWIVSSLGEEVVYRGFLMTRLAEARGRTRGAWVMATVISAVVFGLVHFTWGVVGIVQTTLMGGALGIAYLLLGRNLWILVLAHALMDTLLLVQVYTGSAGTTG